ncbi:hypothetical protein J1N35_013199 [Gossypium stocksii]|uniref:DUF4220 domain-containing protein n=1 Tax=Gossypium stocksii TaxID=47602 RepID=A0A9D3VTA6_9ROSI|nr:hypothetical protein J1N35_013199 [Gossypium stocksii]
MLFLAVKNKSGLKTVSNDIILSWLKWEIRVMVILSLTIQLILIRIGNRRRFSGKYSKLVGVLVWTLYVSADWLATLALGTLLRSRKDIEASPLLLFWAPFLLLYLGGPDTITAYSLSDNELWPLHFFGLCFQIGVALYLYANFWIIASKSLIVTAIPIFIVGIIKYGERVWALFNASSVQFRKSVFSGYKGSHLEVESPSERGMRLTLEEYLEPKQIKGKYGDLYRAYHLFHVFKPMFADLKLRFYQNLSYLFELDQNKVSAEAAFTIVEIELGFLYDLLYTKIPIVITRPGVILRFICLSFTIFTLLAFIFVVGKHNHSRVDVGISYLLMGAAIFLEIYSAFLHLSSDWGIYWLAQQNNRFLRVIGSKLVRFTKPKEGIQSMAQRSLLDYCLPPRKLNLAAVLNFLYSEDSMGKYLRTRWRDVSPELQQFIYSGLQEKRKKYAETEFKNLSQLLDERGSSVPKGMGDEDGDILWSICGVEFTHSLILWHVATEVVFYDDNHRYRAVLDPYCRISKALSDYMMYLLSQCPAMLPEGIGQIRLRDTCSEAMNFSLHNSHFKEAVRGFLGMDIRSRSFLIQMGSSRKSAFFEGCQIAQHLQSLVSDFQWDNQDKWKLIADMWLNMLTYAAAHCSWKEHARRLKHGDEFLTHVALLMAHLGLSKNIQMVPLSHMLKDAGFEPTFHWDKLHRLLFYLD